MSFAGVGRGVSVLIAAKRTKILSSLKKLTKFQPLSDYFLELYDHYNSETFSEVVL